LITYYILTAAVRVTGTCNNCWLVPLHRRHWNNLSFCPRNFLSWLQATVWTEAALVLLFKARSSSTWMSYVPHRKRKMFCLSDARHCIHCWRHWQRTCCLPSISGLYPLCLWLADSRTEKSLDKESGAVSVLENEQRTVVTMTAYWTFMQLL